MVANANSISAEAQPVVSPSVCRNISGFWQRLLAFILDGIILGVVGFISGLLLFDFYAHLGGLGRLLGFCVALIYFALLNSSIGKGQTIGKRIMKIEVVDKSGDHISPFRSFIRYTVIGVPFFLNGALIPLDLAVAPIGILIGFTIFGIGGATIYLYIFNRLTRQSLHDLIVGTFVTKISPKGSLNHVSVWRAHLVITGIWFIAVLGFSIFIPSLSNKGVFPNLFAVQKSIQSSGKVHAATVFEGKSWTMGSYSKTETSYFHSNAILKERPIDYEALAKEIALIVLSVHPEIESKDIVRITLTYGYDIGIARAWRRHSFQHSPNEWQKILGDAKFKI